MPPSQRDAPAARRRSTRSEALRASTAERAAASRGAGSGRSAARSSAARTPLGWLRAQWSEARGGSGRLAVIAGEPGIGKTRLASELARAAHERGRGGAPRPLSRGGADLLPAVRRGVRSLRRGGARRRCCGARSASDGGELARLVPELARRLAELPEPVGGDAEGERFRLFEAACSLLANASRSWPVVLVLEDLHWADKPTALLLAHVVRSIQTERVLVIGTYRDTEPGEPLVSVLADLHRERAVERLRLGSLHRGEVATMISAWLGRAPPTHFAHALHRETEGNPFFIEEVLRHLIEVGAVDETEWRRLASFTELGIPDGVREAIERRLAALSPAARRIVTMAAAIGRSFSIEVLEALAELPGERLLEALEEASGAPDRRGGARCSGALHLRPRADSRDALRVAERAAPSGSAPPDRRDPRTAARRRPPNRLSASSPTTSSRPPSPAAAAKAVDFSARAARRALAALAYEEAVGHFDRALEALRALGRPPTRRPAATLLLGLGEAHGKASEFEQSRARLPGRRGARADGRPRGAPRPRGARPRPGLDRAGHRRPGDHRPARGGARRAARDADGAPRQAARPPRHGASLLQRAGALPGAGAAGRGAGPAAG